MGMEHSLFSIQTIGLSDCFEYNSNIPQMAQQHECEATEGTDFARYHLLLYFNEAKEVVRDLLTIDNVLENIRKLVKIVLMQKGFHENEIDNLNTCRSIENYA